MNRLGVVVGDELIGGRNTEVISLVRVVPTLVCDWQLPIRVCPTLIRDVPMLVCDVPTVICDVPVLIRD